VSALQYELRRIVALGAAVLLSSLASGCLVDVTEEEEPLAEDAVALSDGELDAEPTRELDAIEVGDERALLGSGESEGDPEPLPGDERALGDDVGGPEPQPWYEDGGDEGGPEPQPWKTGVAGEGDDTSLPGQEESDDDEPDPSPWLAQLAKSPLTPGD
jgi:hypothetical protein